MGGLQCLNADSSQTCVVAVAVAGRGSWARTQDFLSLPPEPCQCRPVPSKELHTLVFRYSHLNRGQCVDSSRSRGVAGLVLQFCGGQLYCNTSVWDCTEFF